MIHHGSQYIPVRQAQYIGRLLATLAALPALVLSPLGAQAILIHDHHGHDTHSHTLSVHELGHLQSNSEHQHAEHEHGGPAVESALDESSALVILLDLPESLARGRMLSGNTAAAANGLSAPPTNAVAFVTPQSDRSYPAQPATTRLAVRANRILDGILLTSHALLL